MNLVTRAIQNIQDIKWFNIDNLWKEVKQKKEKKNKGWKKLFKFSSFWQSWQKKKYEEKNKEFYLSIEVAKEKNIGNLVLVISIYKFSSRL